VSQSKLEHYYVPAPETLPKRTLARLLMAFLSRVCIWFSLLFGMAISAFYWVTILIAYTQGGTFKILMDYNAIGEGYLELLLIPVIVGIQFVGTVKYLKGEKK